MLTDNFQHPDYRLRRAWPQGPGQLSLELVGATGIVAAQWHNQPDQASGLLPATPDEERQPYGVGWLTLHLHGRDRRLPGLAALLRRTNSELIAHRAERRAVVRKTNGAQVSYYKLVRPSTLAALITAHQCAALLVGAHVQVPVLRDANHDLGISEWTALPGVPLSTLLASAAATEPCRAFGAALRSLHRAAVPAGWALAHHDATAEQGVLRDWQRKVAWWDAAHAAALAPAIEACCAALAALPAVPAQPIHRDCYEQQVIVAADGQIGLLDFDTLALGDPALDLGNFAAHLDLRVAQGTLSEGAAARAWQSLLAGYAAEDGLLARVAVYRQASWLRLQCVHRFRRGV